MYYYLGVGLVANKFIAASTFIQNVEAVLIAPPSITYQPQPGESFRYLI